MGFPWQVCRQPQLFALTPPADETQRMKGYDRASMFLYQFRDFGEALGIPSETENGGDEG